MQERTSAGRNTLLREFTFEQASVTLRFTFNKILPILPGPGTSAFAVLARDLRLYGMSASGVAVESPSSRLSEVSVSISLLDDRATVRLLYGWFELAIFKLFEEDLEPLARIAEIVSRALKEVDDEVQRGALRVDCIAHVRLAPGEADTYLQEHLPSAHAVLKPDAFAFRFAGDGHEELRVVVARSVRYEASLFIDYSRLYPPTDSGIPPLLDLKRHYAAALAKLGLGQKHEREVRDHE